jgi:S-adenosylmethionine synthetase
MFEKVNPHHPDKMCDRLAGAITDLAYAAERNPRIAVEVLAGHGKVYVIIETNLSREQLRPEDVNAAIFRIFGENVNGQVTTIPQDPHLAHNQDHGFRCGDNGIFRGSPVTHEQRILTALAATIHANFPTDGKYIINNLRHDTHPAVIGETRADITICQSRATQDEIHGCLMAFKERAEQSLQECFTPTVYVNPLGPWTGGPDVDCGATNRKLGSDMGDAVTGGGLFGKDLSKADVSVNIVCHIKATHDGAPVTASCSIGDESVTFHHANGTTDTMPFPDVVEQARLYILTDCGGSFEKFAEWGLIRPAQEA